MLRQALNEKKKKKKLNSQKKGKRATDKRTESHSCGENSTEGSKPLIYEANERKKMSPHPLGGPAGGEIEGINWQEKKQGRGTFSL